MEFVLEINTGTRLNDETGEIENMWLRVGNSKSFVDEKDAEVWRERFYPTNAYRIRKSNHQ